MVGVGQNQIPVTKNQIKTDIFENSDYGKDTLESDKDAGRDFIEEKISLFLKLSFKNKHFQQTDTNQQYWYRFRFCPCWLLVWYLVGPKMIKLSFKPASCIQQFWLTSGFSIYFVRKRGKICKKSGRVGTYEICLIFWT